MLSVQHYVQSTIKMFVVQQFCSVERAVQNQRTIKWSELYNG